MNKSFENSNLKPEIKILITIDYYHFQVIHCDKLGSFSKTSNYSNRWKTRISCNVLASSRALLHLFGRYYIGFTVRILQLNQHILHLQFKYFCFCWLFVDYATAPYIFAFRTRIWYMHGWQSQGKYKIQKFYLFCYLLSF